MNLHELRAQVEEIRSTVVRLSEIDDITPEDDEELTAALETYEARKTELDELEARAARIEAAKAAATERHAGIDSPTILKRVEPSVLDLRTATRGELRDAALKVLETEGRGLAAHQEDHVDTLLRSRSVVTDGSIIARRILATETPAYRSAFAKAVTQPVPAFDADEVRAINEYRAMAEGVDTSGGFGVVAFLDPTIILTSGAAAAPVLNLAKIVTITTDEWKGVSSAATSWSYDGEGTEVSDDAPTLAQPTVPVYTARGFIPFSAEIGADYVGFAAEMRALLDQGYIDLVANQTINGSGSSQPTGIFVAASNATSQVVVTTDAAFGAVDLLKVWKALPERYKGNASWIMHTDVENEIRTFGNGDNSAYYSVNLAAGGIGTLFGRPIYTTDYAPEFTGTTGIAGLLVVGDFQNFVVAQRAGMSVELIPHLFGATNARPTNQRGFFATARHGFDAVNDNAFRLLQNT
jgi:HK97 family phage major capsid protein